MLLTSSHPTQLVTRDLPESLHVGGHEPVTASIHCNYFALLMLLLYHQPRPVCISRHTFTDIYFFQQIVLDRTHNFCFAQVCISECTASHY